MDVSFRGACAETLMAIRCVVVSRGLMMVVWEMVDGGVVGVESMTQEKKNVCDRGVIGWR